MTKNYPETATEVHYSKVNIAFYSTVFSDVTLNP